MQRETGEVQGETLKKCKKEKIFKVTLFIKIVINHVKNKIRVPKIYFII